MKLMQRDKDSMSRIIGGCSVGNDIRSVLTRMAEQQLLIERGELLPIAVRKNNENRSRQGRFTIRS